MLSEVILLIPDLRQFKSKSKHG